MNFQVGEIYEGFKLLEKSRCSDEISTELVFEHLRSKAKVIFCRKSDENKLFSITLRTIANNDKGIPHILEHSLLKGSRKFGSNSMMYEMNGTYGVYLNGLTLEDRTMFVVSAKDSKTFLQLVYMVLDSVFYPNIYENENIFLSEGWRCEYDEQSKKFHYNGRVYNEMKASAYTTDKILYREIRKSLFNKEPYCFEAGGIPENIVESHYSEIIEFHNTYYIPSNMCMFFYGNLDIIPILKLINEEYLSVDKEIHKIEIKKCKPKIQLNNNYGYYPVASNISNDECIFTLNFVINDFIKLNNEHIFEVIKYIFIKSEMNSLKTLLYEEGIRGEVFCKFYRYIAQPVFTIGIKNALEEDEYKFIEIVTNFIESIVKNGIDKSIGEAAINYIKIKEANIENDISKILKYNMEIVNNWVCDEEVNIFIKEKDPLKDLKLKLENNYFEEIVSNFLLNNSYKSLVKLKAKENMLYEINEALDFKISKLKDKKQLIKNDVDKHSNFNININSSSFKIKDIKDLIRNNTNYCTLKSGNTTIIYKNLNNNEEINFNILFDISILDKKLIPYATLLANILGKIPINHNNYNNLQKRRDLSYSKIEFTTDLYVLKGSNYSHKPKFKISCKVIGREINQILDYIYGILNYSDFSNDSTIKRLIYETKNRYEEYFLKSGHLVAAERLMAYSSACGQYKDKLEGLEFYCFIAGLWNNYESHIEEIKNNLKETCKLITNKKNMIVSLECDERNYKNSIKSVCGFMEKLDEFNDKNSQYFEKGFVYRATNENIIIPANTLHVAKGINILQLGYKYSSKLMVLENILATKYLDYNLREVRGAYGGYCITTKSGNFMFLSYRDSDIYKTLEVYNNINDFINNINIDKYELDKYKLNALNRFNIIFNNKLLAEKICGYHIKQYEYLDFEKELEEIVDMNLNDIKFLGNMVKDVVNKGDICVVGGEAEIKKYENIFNKSLTI